MRTEGGSTSWKAIVNGEWFDVSKIQSFEESIHVFQENTAIYTHTIEIDCTKHCLNINMLYRYFKDDS